MAVCLVCGKQSPLISRALPFCRDCILKSFEQIRPTLDAIHARSRARFNLPPAPPQDPGGKICRICARECRIGEGQRGFCGLRVNRKGKVASLGGTAKRGFLDFYYDPLPTNCVADWVCSGHSKFGYYNLAVFYEACNLNCLFCQNFHFRATDFSRAESLPADEIADKVHPKTYCVCFFGGDPSPQVSHALALGKRLFAERGIVVCFETNGLFNEKALMQVCEIVAASGGRLKFDIKAFSPQLYYAMTGYDGRKVYENFRKAAEFFGRQASLFLVASTLMVPGLVDREEVEGIASFIASIDPAIPYALLGFAPHFEMNDLPTTSWKQAERCMEAAKKAGLENVRIGNTFLLS